MSNPRLLKVLDDQNRAMKLLMQKCDRLQKIVDRHAALHDEHDRRLAKLERHAGLSHAAGGAGPTRAEATKIAFQSRAALRENIRKRVI